MEEERIWQIKVTCYWVLMPFAIVVGLAINAVGIYLLCRPRMQCVPATTQFDQPASLPTSNEPTRKSVLDSVR
ncbi:hypothetical protein E2C01_072559 [Portunus trituberculatus]|uniref:Uncharacterized protein n=1 Tax=Portunus trituberculatus TaxID=210409 RepID=A0A5B7IBN0_PORTR|nr:hypothetical protein [Portunus trituberculatus]